MTYSYNHVNPGDLITAQFVNELIDQLKSLDIRITDLEAGNKKPLLYNLSPTGDVAIGSKLTLNGRNFLMGAGLNTVHIGSIDVKDFIDATDQTLSLQVPDLFTGLPDDYNVSVTNLNGTSNALQVHLIEGAPPTQGGGASIVDQSQSPGQINANSVYTFKWLVASNTTLPATYDITVAYTNVNGSTLKKWQDATKIDPPGQQTIVRGTPITVTATITVPSDAKSVDFTLQVLSTDKQFSGSSSVITLTVGQTTVTSDPRCMVVLGDITPLDPLTGLPNLVQAFTIADANGTMINGAQLTFGGKGNIPINITPSVDQPGVGSASGTYVFTASIESMGTLWKLDPITPNQRDLLPGVMRTLFVPLTNTDTGSTAAIKYMVVSASHQLNGATDFVSFARFPIRGYTPTP